MFYYFSTLKLFFLNEWKKRCRESKPGALIYKQQEEEEEKKKERKELAKQLGIKVHTHTHTNKQKTIS